MALRWFKKTIILISYFWGAINFPFKGRCSHKIKRLFVGTNSHTKKTTQHNWTNPKHTSKKPPNPHPFLSGYFSALQGVATTLAHLWFFSVTFHYDPSQLQEGRRIMSSFTKDLVLLCSGWEIKDALSDSMWFLFLFISSLTIAGQKD